VLEKILKSKQPIPGEKGLLLSFGAGFSAFGALVTFW
jgi:3-oxoacyl-[acyl-carrier-protein] synthase III